MNDVKEILWELTLRCNKNCKDCHLHELLNSNIEKESEEGFYHIISEIESIKPEKLILTGGEPVLFSHFNEVINELSKRGINIIVSTNGKIFELMKKNCFSLLIDKKIFWYRYSINTEEDLKQLKDVTPFVPFEKTTMFTTFGSYNLSLFQKLAKAASNFPSWQIQLSMNDENRLDIYEGSNLLNKIHRFKEAELSTVILSNNFNTEPCKAGKTSFSICYNGDVVPCLSYREWKKTMNVIGNLFKTPLKTIWEKDFEKFRNRTFNPCCKDFSGIHMIKQNNLITNSNY